MIKDDEDFLFGIAVNSDSKLSDSESNVLSDHCKDKKPKPITKNYTDKIKAKRLRVKNNKKSRVLNSQDNDIPRNLMKKSDVKEKLALGLAQGVKIIVDNSFDEFQSEKELRRLVRQFSYIYNTIKYSQNLFQLNIVNCSEDVLHLMALNKQVDWVANITKKSIEVLIQEKALDKSSLVYLSPDGDEFLYNFDISKSYIIGGIVDGNPIKGLSRNRAAELGIKSFKLPIEEFLSEENKSIKLQPVLNLNHVVEILDNYLNTKDLKKSILKVIPNRFTSKK